MPKTKAKKKRSRLGYVMVELSPEERAKIELLCEQRRIATGEKASLASTFRYLLREATR